MTGGWRGPATAARLPAMRIMARAGLALLCLLLAPALALARPPVWVVRDKDSTITLFGSVHVLPQGLDWRPPALARAMAGADDIWFEAPMDQAGLTAATQEALAHAFLPEGQTLKPMLSRAGRTRLAAIAREGGLPPEEFDRLRPWYAELMVQGIMFRKVGAEGADGVEQQLWAGVPPGAKRVALETVKEQIGFFADAPAKEQLASLEQTLKDAANAEHDYQLLLKAWMAGDVRTLDREVVIPLKKTSPTLYVRLVTERNARWIDALTRRMAGSGNTVIVVGMGHLIGPDGLPAQLRARGYRVEGPRSAFPVQRPANRGTLHGHGARPRSSAGAHHHRRVRKV